MSLTSVQSIEIQNQLDVEMDVQYPLAGTAQAQTKTATPTKQIQNIRPDSGYLLSQVTINPIPAQYIVPGGKKTITSNGEDIDVTEYASVKVEVPTTGGTLQEKTATPTENTQVINPDSGYDGMSKVTINPIPSEYIIPSGTKAITQNGTEIDVTEYATANVNVQPTLQEKTVNQNGNVLPDVGYDGLSKVVVNVPSPSGTLSITNNGTFNVTDYASAEVNVSGGTVETQTKTVTPSQSQQTVNPDSGYLLSQVTVNPIPSEYVIPEGTKSITANGESDVTNFANVNVNVQPTLENKSVTPSENTQSITAGSGYDGLGTVTVNPIPSQYIVPSGTLSITENGTTDVSQYASVDINVESDLETKTITITENGTTTYSPSATKDGFSSVEVTVNVPSAPTPTETKTITPSEYTQQVTPQEGYALSQVTVNPIPSQYIVPSGTKNITQNGSGIDVTEYSNVDVNVTPPLQNKTVTPTTSEQTINADSGNYGLNTVTVNGVTASIDANIIATNIKNGVTILGVNGTLEEVKPTETATVTPTEQTQTITPSANHVFSQVTVNAIPPQYIVPSGTTNITQNGSAINISQYEFVNVNVQPTYLGNATPSDVLSGKTFYSDSGTLQTGTIATYDGDSTNTVLRPLIANQTYYTIMFDTSTTVATVKGVFEQIPSESWVDSGLGFDVCYFMGEGQEGMMFGFPVFAIRQLNGSTYRYGMLKWQGSTIWGSEAFSITIAELGETFDFPNGWDTSMGRQYSPEDDDTPIPYTPTSEILSSIWNGEIIGGY